MNAKNLGGVIFMGQLLSGIDIMYSAIKGDTQFSITSLSVVINLCKSSVYIEHIYSKCHIYIKHSQYACTMIVKQKFLTRCLEKAWK